MTRYFVSLAYKGTAYHGWQIQQNALTVQQILEERMSLKLRQKITLTGAGRTDTGVHASYYIAHFDSNEELKNKPQLIHSINSFLPGDIKIFDIVKVIPSAHARFDAISRTYHYFFATMPTPFLNDYAWALNFNPDLKRLQESLDMIKGRHDFEAFSKKDKSAKTSICDIKEASVHKTTYGFYIKITADRFLRNMVRAIVGTLIHISKNNLPATHILEVLETKDRSKAASSAPPQGLFFTNVDYPEQIFAEYKPAQIKNFLLP